MHSDPTCRRLRTVGNGLAAVTIMCMIVTLNSVLAFAAAPDANLVFGMVSDLTGKPIGGAHIQAQSAKSEPLGDARSDREGRFRIRCRRAAPDVTLVVDGADRFHRYAMSGFKTDGPPASIVLTRVIDAAYMAEIAREPDPARFRARAADLLAPSQGTTGTTFPLEEIVPALAALRQPLRAWLPADPARVAAARLPDDQDRALRMLALRGDPRDDQLLEAWMAGDAKRIAHPPRTCRGATPGDAMREWETAHFEKEGYREGQQRPYTSSSIVWAPDRDHVVISHFVGYENWSYSHWLVLVRTPYDWELRWVLPHASIRSHGAH
jgi:hypothetical protein